MTIISEDSIQSAENVEETILSLIEDLAIYPEKHPKDKYKQNNRGDIRAFEKFNFRISYKYTDKEIRILRIRHVKQNPKSY